MFYIKTDATSARLIWFLVGYFFFIIQSKSVYYKHIFIQCHFSFAVENLYLHLKDIGIMKNYLVKWP